MKTLKQEIKELAQGQAILKEQRKTINFKGIRQFEPSQASYYHLLNRNKLRILNVALGLLKGRTIEQIESKSKHPLNMHDVNKTIEKYEQQYKLRSVGKDTDSFSDTYINS